MKNAENTNSTVEELATVQFEAKYENAEIMRQEIVDAIDSILDEMDGTDLVITYSGSQIKLEDITGTKYYHFDERNIQLNGYTVNVKLDRGYLVYSVGNLEIAKINIKF